jgi:hypothetical protein
LPLIDFLSFSPVARPEDADAALAPGEAHRYHAAIDEAEAEVARLTAAVAQVLRNDAARIEERLLHPRKRHAVL